LCKDIGDDPVTGFTLLIRTFCEKFTKSSSLTHSELGFSPRKAVRTYADVVLPLALPKPFTYLVPEQWVEQLRFGMRVEVQFGRNKLYSGLVVALHQQPPQVKKPKAILAVIDEAPILQPL
jgi:hypothetical protein